MLAFLKICRWMALQKIEHSNLLFGISFKMLVQHTHTILMTTEGICEGELRPSFFWFQSVQEKDALKGIFESFQNNVKAPITAFAAMTEQARQVFEHDASIPLPQSKALCDTDRNLALQNGR